MRMRRCGRSTRAARRDVESRVPGGAGASNWRAHHGPVVAGLPRPAPLSTAGLSAYGAPRLGGQTQLEADGVSVVDSRDTSAAGSRAPGEVAENAVTAGLTVVSGAARIRRYPKTLSRIEEALGHPLSLDFCELGARARGLSRDSRVNREMTCARPPLLFRDRRHIARGLICVQVLNVVRSWQTLPMDSAVELHLRQLIFDRLTELVADQGTVTRAQLESLQVGDQTHRLIDQSRGIRNPKDMLATLSVVSSPDGPYSDSQLGDALFAYDYRKGSTDGDNLKMRRAVELGLPIILLRKIRAGLYVPVFPAYVIKDDTASRQFLIALDESLSSVADPLHLEPIERKYGERAMKQRLHQPEFRGRIMLAYERKCTVCRLKHGRLLDAAHIVGDDKPHGLPLVENGLSLCKIHHAAYDANLLGISPDYVVRINGELMDEVDGPMLQHGLKEMDGRGLTLPKRRVDRPSKDRLAERFEEFSAAS